MRIKNKKTKNDKRREAPKSRKFDNLAKHRTKPSKKRSTANNKRSVGKHSNALPSEKNSFLSRVRKALPTILIILISIWFYLNWTDIMRYLESIKLDDLVSVDVIPPFDSVDSPHRSSGVIKIAIVIMDPSEEVETISSIFILTSSEQKGAYLTQYIPGGVYISPYNSDLSSVISMSDLHYVGERYEEGLGVEYTLWQLEKLLATEFDGYVWFSRKGTRVLVDEFGFEVDSTPVEQLRTLNRLGSIANLLFRLKYIGSVSEYTYSNLDITRIYRLMSHFEPERMDQTFLNYGLIDYLTPSVHLNGREIFILEEGKIDESIRALRDQMISKDLEREQAKVEIYNGSSIPGLASRYSRIFRNNNISIIRIGNSEESYEKTTIYVTRPEEFANTLNYVTVLLGSNEIEIKNSRPLFMATGDVVVILGEELNESSLPYVTY